MGIKAADYMIDGAEYLIEDGAPFDDWFDHEAFKRDYGMNFHEFFFTSKTHWGFDAAQGSKGKHRNRKPTPRMLAHLGLY